MILHAVSRGTGRGSPLVLLHGLFGRASNFGMVTARLANAGRRVLALDLRNHGTSPHGLPMDYATMAGDVAETLVMLELRRVCLVGHSMGGKVAMTLALSDPGVVERLCVVDIAPVRYAPRFRDFTAAMQALPLSRGLTRAAADATLLHAVPDARVRAFLLQNLRTGDAPAWTIGLDEIAGSLETVGDFPALPGPYPGPALFLHGAQSDYVTPEAWPAIRRLFPAAVPAALQTGHWVHAEDPDGFVAAVDAFMR